MQGSVALRSPIQLKQELLRFQTAINLYRKSWKAYIGSVVYRPGSKAAASFTSGDKWTFHSRKTAFWSRVPVRHDHHTFSPPPSTYVALEPINSHVCIYMDLNMLKLIMNEKDFHRKHDLQINWSRSKLLGRCNQQILINSAPLDNARQQPITPKILLLLPITWHCMYTINLKATKILWCCIGVNMLLYQTTSNI